MAPVLPMVVSMVMTLLFALPLQALQRVANFDVPTSDELKCVAFDHKGYMWVGTSSGLFRFDGYGYQQYRSSMATPGMLANNYIQCITADGHNNLWVGTDGGVTRMNLTTGAMTHYRPSGKNQGIVYVIYCSRRGDVWAGTDGGLLRFDARRGRFAAEDLGRYRQLGPDGRPKTFIGLSVKAFAEDRDGTLFLGTWNHGVVMLDPQRRVLRQMPANNNNVYALCLDDAGNLWSGSWNGGLSVVTRRGRAAHQKPVTIGGTERERIYRIVYDSVSHSVAACARNAVYRLTPRDAVAGRPVPENVATKGTEHLFCDLAVNGRGDLVAITLNNDMQLFSPATSPLTLHTLPADAVGGHLGRINALYTPDGRQMGLGTVSWRLLFYDLATNFLTGASGQANITDMPEDNCTVIAPRANGETWVGFYYYGALALRTGAPARLMNHDTLPFLANEGVLSLLGTRDGTMWVGQWSAISMVRPDNSGASVSLPRLFPGFYRGRVVNLMMDHRGRLWASVHENGVVRIDRMGTTAATTRLTVIDRRHGRYPSAGAIACLEDHRHRVWSITAEGELVRWDEQKGAFVDDPRYDQLREHRLYAINQDQDGYLWLAARNHLIRMDVADDGSLRSLRFFSPRSGANLKIQENATSRWGDRLYFGGVGQVLEVDTRVLRQKVAARRAMLTVTDLTLNDRSYALLDSADRARVSDATPAYARSIVIAPSVRRFGIAFSALSYNDNGETIYAYWLEGYNHQWETCDNGVHEARFENMPSGTYRLHLRSMDAGGQWQEMPYTLEIRVLPPWWASWWAWTVYVLLAALAVWGATRWYRIRLRTRNRLALAQLFTNITHELLTPVAVITASVDTARGLIGEEKYQVMHNNARRLTRLIRQMLEVDKINTGRERLLVSRGDLTAFLQEMGENMRPMAESRQIAMRLELAQAPASTYFDPDKVDKMVYNLLSNAIKYTPEGGQVTLTCDYPEAGSVRISVADTGIGIDPGRMKHLYSRFMDGDYRKMGTMGTGIGLSLTRDLVVLHHGHIECESTPGQGTTFTITLPTSRQAYAKEEIDGKGRPAPQQAEQQRLTTAVDEEGGKPEERALQHERDYTVLVVEDNPDLLRLMEETLGRYYHVLTARDGRQALNVIGRHALDIVVSDVMMPVMDGIELTRAIKGNDDYAMLPVILLTAKVANKDRREGYLVGADDYLAKPFDMETLRVRIDNFMVNRERLRRKFMAQTEFRPEEQHYSDPNAQFMERAVAMVRAHLADPDYDRERFAADMCMSSSLLYKKLTALTGQNVSAFVNSIKLKKACAIARREPGVTVADLCARLGYGSPSYFSRVFKKEFGITFTEFVAGKE